MNCKIKNNDFTLVYEDIILEHNLNVLCEEVETLHSLITEENFLTKIKEIFQKFGDFLSQSTSFFKKGYDSLVNFCKKIFQLTHVKAIMNKLGLTDDKIQQYLGIAKSCLVILPVAKIGYGIVERTYKDIKGNDVAILIDREAFNKKSAKLFSEQSFLEKSWTIIKSASQAIVAEFFASIPLILKCLTGYIVTEAIMEATKNPKFLTTHQEQVLERMDEVTDWYGNKKPEIDPKTGKVKKGSAFYTQEEVMAMLNEYFSSARLAHTSIFSMFARNEMMRNMLARDENGNVSNVYGTHYNITNHGAPDLAKGIRTRFNGKKYVEEKLSPTEGFAEAMRQMQGGIGYEAALGIPGY